MEIESLPVVILAGGKGTRLGNEYELLPKPLVKIGEYPIIIHIMAIYYRYGLRNFIVCTGFKADEFHKFFKTVSRYEHSDCYVLDSSMFDNLLKLDSRQDKTQVSVKLCDTGLETTTGGRLKKVYDLTNSKVVLATYGDGVADINLERVIGLHFKGGFEVTLSGFHPPSRFGELIVSETGKVLSFKEKQLSSAIVNAGFFVINRESLLDIDEEQSLEEGFLTYHSSAGTLGAYIFDTRWQMMDTPREVEILRKEVENDVPFWLHKNKIYKNAFSS